MHKDKLFLIQQINKHHIYLFITQYIILIRRFTEKL